MKYIIEIAKEYEEYFKGILICGIADGKFAVDVIAREDLEELTSDYINEHYGQLQDEAYQRGYKDCETRYCSFDACPNRRAEYQRGLDDAWEAARKIALMDTETSENVTGYFGLFRIMENLTPMQAIEKLKAYKEKQKEEAEDEIRVGDEVAFHHDDGRPDTVVVVTYIGQDGFIDGMDGRGTQYAHKNPTKWTKTGRHFDIASILEDMRND